MKALHKLIFALLALMAAGAVFAAGPDIGNVSKQETNWTAIGMFGAFIAGTL